MREPSQVSSAILNSSQSAFTIPVGDWAAWVPAGAFFVVDDLPVFAGLLGAAAQALPHAREAASIVETHRVWVVAFIDLFLLVAETPPPPVQDRCQSRRGKGRTGTTSAPARAQSRRLRHGQR